MPQRSTVDARTGERIEGASVPGRTRSAWLVGLTGTAIGCGIVVRLLSLSHMDPSILLAVGEGKPIQRAYAERLLGSVVTRPQAGHDGKFFFIQANDPWYVQPRENAVALDRPLYRGQRMLYPMLAGGFGLFPPEVVVWGLIVVNVVALGIGSFAAAQLAISWNVSPWLGLAVALNIGLIFELLIDGSGVLAFACCLLALWAMTRDRTWLAAMGFAAGALSREVMLLFALGVTLRLWLDERRVRWRLVAVPVLAVATWNLYLRIRLSGVSGTGGAPQLLDLPFVGAARAIRAWDTPSDLALNLCIVAVAMLFTVLAARSDLLLAWGALPFVLLSVVLAEGTWAEPFDLSRALTPIFTAAPFLLAIRRRDTVRPMADAPTVGR